METGADHCSKWEEKSEKMLEMTSTTFVGRLETFQEQEFYVGLGWLSCFPRKYRTIAHSSTADS